MAGHIALVLGSILSALIMLELGVRASRGWETLTDWPNLVLQARMQSWARGELSSAVPDSRLGFVGRPNYVSSDGQLTYDARGRLMNVQHSGSVNANVVTRYQYDKADNRTLKNVTGAP